MKPESDLEFDRAVDILLRTPPKPHNADKANKGKTKGKKVRGTSRGDGGTAKAG